MTNDNEPVLPAVADDLDLWLCLLADNELAAGQRQQLVVYLDQHPEHWRDCGLKLIESQSLVRGLRGALEFVALASETPADRALPPEYREDRCGVSKVARRNGKPSAGIRNGELVNGKELSGAFHSEADFEFEIPSKSAELPQASPSPGAKRLGRSQVSGRQRWTLGSRRWVVGAAMVCASCLLVLVGWKLHHELVAQRLFDRQQEAMAMLERELEVVRQRVEAEPAAGQRQAAYRPLGLAANSTMIEVANDDQRAVYYTEKAIPRFLMEALVFAGHDMEVGIEMTEVMLDDGTRAEIPFHVLEIKKSALLASVFREALEDSD